MEITKFDTQALDDIAESFVDSFPDWNIENAKKYLMQSCLTNPDFCFMALNKDKEILGAIFSKVGPSKSGNILVVESLQVIKKYRNKGVGKSLLKHTVEESRKNHILNISMLSPEENDFPFSWYERIGFKKTGWVELSVTVEKIKNLDKKNIISL